MSTKLGKDLVITPPETWDDLKIMWAENFAILSNAMIADHVITNTHLVENTTDETEVIHADLKPHDLVQGLHIRTHVEGIYSNDSAADDFTIRFYVDGTLLHTLNRVAGNVTDQFWEAQYELTVLTEGVTGSLIDSARFTDGVIGYAQAELNPHDPFDTTVELELRITIQWDNAKAGNTLKAQQGHFEFIKGTIED